MTRCALHQGHSGRLAARPPPSATPLPATFGLAADPSTRPRRRRRPLGWQPAPPAPPLERAQSLLTAWRSGAPVGRGRAAQQLARRLVAAGAFHPVPRRGHAARRRHRRHPCPGPPRPAAPTPRRLAGLACVVVDDASADPGIEDIAERTAPRASAWRSTSGRPAPATPAWPRPQPAGGLHRLRLPADRRMARTPARLLRRPAGRRRGTPGLAAQPDRLGDDSRGHRSTWRQSAGSVRPMSRSPTSPAQHWWCGPTWPTGASSTRRSGAARTSTWSGAWPRPAGTSATARPAGGAPRPVPLGAFLARRFFYGTTAGPLSRRHGQASPRCTSPAWSLPVWGLLRLAARSWPARAGGLHPLAGPAADRPVRDPVDVATRIVGGGTARAALPALSSLTRAWGPAFVLGLLFRRTRGGLGARPPDPGPLRLRHPTPNGESAPRSGGPCGGRRRLRRRGVARVRTSAPWSRSSRGCRGGHACGRRRLFATSCRPDHGSNRIRNRRATDTA